MRLESVKEKLSEDVIRDTLEFALLNMGSRKHIVFGITARAIQCDTTGEKNEKHYDCEGRKEFSPGIHKTRNKYPGVRRLNNGIQVRLSVAP